MTQFPVRLIICANKSPQTKTHLLHLPQFCKYLNDGYHRKLLLRFSQHNIQPSFLYESFKETFSRVQLGCNVFTCNVYFMYYWTSALSLTKIPKQNLFIKEHTKGRLMKSNGRSRNKQSLCEEETSINAKGSRN
jgi:hypothetical protein